MFDAFAQDTKDNENTGLQVYMPKSKARALGPQEIGQFVKNQSAPQMGMPSGGGGMPMRGGMPQAPPAGGGIGLPNKKPGGDQSAGVPDYEMRPPDFSGVPNYTGADPWDPKHYEGIFLDPNNPIWGDIQTGLQDLINPVFDPSNYEGLFDGSLSGDNPVFNPGAYEGTLYNPDDPFGLNSPGGGMGEGLMGNIGNLASLIGIGKGIYGLTQGSGGQGGVDLATGIAGKFMPMIGVMKGIFDAVMGVGQYVQGQGRQYDYFHPYLNNQLESKDGYRVMNVGWEDDQGDAAGREMTGGDFYQGYDPDFELNPGLKTRAAQNMIEKDGQLYFIDDVANYLGMDDYSKYLSANGLDRPGMMDDVMGGNSYQNWKNELDKSGLMAENDYNKMLNDSFINAVTQQGINWDSDALHRANAGMFKDQPTMMTTWDGDNANKLVKLWEMTQMMQNNNNFMDTSGWADYQAPELPTYSRPVAPTNDYGLMGI
jgi:hypothetical protein